MHERMRQTRQIYAGRMVRLRVDEVVREDGSRSFREVVSHPGAVAIVASPRADQILLVRQYRYAVGDCLWEIPAGTREPDEEPLETAQRELAEETGYQAGRMVHLLTVHPSPGFCDERIDLYHATSLSPAEGVAGDADEHIQTHCFSLIQVQAMIQRGEILDAKTLVGLFALTLPSMR